MNIYKTILFLTCTTFLFNWRPLISNPETVVYSASRIKQQIENYLQNDFQSNDYKFEIEWLYPITDVSLLSNPDSVSISYNGDKILKGNKVIKFTFFQKESPQKSLHISVRIHLFQKVFVLIHPLEKNQPLELEKVQIEQRETTTVVGNPLIVSAKIQNLIARRSLPKGRILMERDFRAPFCIKKGETVTVELGGENFFVRLQVLALQNGSVNDMVWVKNLDNRKKMKVRVVGPQLAVLP
jgi:flagella basal body P-ring formation protein FlgA